MTALPTRFRSESAFLLRAIFRFFFRCRKSAEAAEVILEQGEHRVFGRKLMWPKPSEMIRIEIPSGSIPTGRGGFGDEPLILRMETMSGRGEKQ